MIHQKDLGNPYAPAYRQNVAVDDAYVPCDAPGRGVEVYVPAWGFLEQARAVAILDRWARNGSQYKCWTALDGRGCCELIPDMPRAGARYHYGETTDVARAAASKALLAEDPTLGEGLYP